MKITIATCVATLCIASAAVAAEPNSAPPAVEPAAPVVKDGDKLICKSVRSTGSYMPQRICMTKAQRAAREATSRKLMDRINARGGAHPGNDTTGNSAVSR